MSLELPPLVRSGVFFVFLWLSGGLSSSVFAVFLAPFLKWVILDYIAHGSFISVFTVVVSDGQRIGDYGDEGENFRLI